MLETITDLLNQAPTPVQFRTLAANPATSPVSADERPRAGEIQTRMLSDPRYGHFARIPGRIVRCLDYFKVGCDRSAAVRILAAYYLFIAVVDDALDSGEPEAAAATVLAHLSARQPEPGSQLSQVAIITEHLKRQLNYEVGSTIRDQFAVLYETVRSERAAASIQAYIEVRKAVGRLTADLSYQLICPVLDHDNHNLRTFMTRVGEVGCLTDSVIDLSADRREGLLNFQPTIRDRFKLALVTCRAGLSIAVDHPRLAGMFAISILDNIHDRFPATGQPQPVVPKDDGPEL